MIVASGGQVVFQLGGRWELINERGAGNVVRFIREVVDATGEDVGVDWHGHDDRGLAVINSLAAAAAGADRLHGTAIGIGERVGNTPIDQLLVKQRAALGKALDSLMQVSQAR